MTVYTRGPLPDINDLFDKELRDHPHKEELSALAWENAYENAIKNIDLIFIYRGVLRKGYLQTIFVRPEKYIWIDEWDDDVCDLDMERLEYDEYDDPQPIVFWLPFDKFPKHLYPLVKGYDEDTDVSSRLLTDEQIQTIEYTIDLEKFLTNTYNKSVLDEQKKDRRPDSTRE